MANLDEMFNWYEAVLGLQSDPRPDFPHGEAWLYTGDTPVEHLVEEAEGVGNRVDRSSAAGNGVVSLAAEAGRNTPARDDIAPTQNGLPCLSERLTAHQG